MKEHPILFSAPMVRAILDGHKTQTRRTVKAYCDDRGLRWIHPKTGWENWHGEWVRCPYGFAGDHLWVKETFNIGWCDQVLYRADGGNALSNGYAREVKWKPSIFMPRKFSRITLEVTDVRVERVQKITAADAMAEGVEERIWIHRDGAPRKGYSADWSRLGELSRFAGGIYPRNDKHPLTEDDIALYSPWNAYANLWIKINGRDSWDANPWVWVIEFKKI